MTISSNTIAAISTPLGMGGIGVIRISGNEAYSLGCQLLNKTVLKPRYAYHGEFIDPNTNDVIDQGLLLYFKGPNSFTGEDVIEIQGHGGIAVMNRLLKLVLSFNIQQAEPGEFSKRAFLNNKIDLVQAEAIADLIHAESEEAAIAAVKSLKGVFSEEINELYHKIRKIRLHVEATLDFPDEDIDFYADGKILEDLNQIIFSIKHIKEAASNGVQLQEGHSIALIGKPNVGKSRIMNCLAQEELAIVTPIAGTTRDVIKATCQFNGLSLQLLDTAGLRNTDNLIEQAGIKRTQQVLQQVDYLLLVIDATHESKDSLNKKTLLDLCSEHQIDTDQVKEVIVCRNKVDKTGEASGWVHNEPYKLMNISALNGNGIQELKECLTALIAQRNSASLGSTRKRHVDAIDQTLSYIKQAHQKLRIKESLELLAEDLKQAQNALALITGKVTVDQLLGDIFSSFCIGK